MGEIDLSTGDPASGAGIYQADCSCRTAVTILDGSALPRCQGCGRAVRWQLVQRVSSPPPSRPGESSTRLRAPSVRPLGVAAGDED
ncbi:MAG: hypothetical protein FJ104_00435 [Deltaproteobacteria bacterium]|nr:hypothetical protein [Deltaproteobacteria bacterium]